LKQTFIDRDNRIVAAGRSIFGGEGPAPPLSATKEKRVTTTSRIFVISLKSALERRDRFSKRAESTGLDWSFYDAHTDAYAPLNYSEERAVRVHGRPLSTGERGCYSSHFSLWRQLIEDEADQYIILEDDVIVNWRTLERLYSRPLAEEQLHYLKLHHKFPSKYIQLSGDWLFRQCFLLELIGQPYGTQGYIITREGARKMIAACEQIRRPIDDQIDRFWETGLPLLCIFPFVVLEDDAPSEIGAARFQPKQDKRRLGYAIELMDRATRRAAGFRSRLSAASRRRLIRSSVLN